MISDYKISVARQTSAHRIKIVVAGRLDKHTCRDLLDSPSSAHLLALFANAEGHAFCFGAQTNQPGDPDDRWFTCSLWCLRCLLDRHIDQAILLKLTLGIEVCHEETSLLVGFRDLSHQLNIQ